MYAYVNWIENCSASQKVQTNLVQQLDSNSSSALTFALTFDVNDDDEYDDDDTDDDKYDDDGEYDDDDKDDDESSGRYTITPFVVSGLVAEGGHCAHSTAPNLSQTQSLIWQNAKVTDIQIQL